MQPNLGHVTRRDINVTVRDDNEMSGCVARQGVGSALAQCCSNLCNDGCSIEPAFDDYIVSALSE